MIRNKALLATILMKITKIKIWIKYFFKSFIWLILPLCIFGNIQSCSSYIEAGKHLTPYSVSVRGYHRSDGTYVSPYKRRPPGSIKHDAPYKRKRKYMGLLFFVCLVGAGGSIMVYLSMCLSAIENINETSQNIENKVRNKEENNLKEKLLETITIGDKEGIGLYISIFNKYILFNVSLPDSRLESNSLKRKSLGEELQINAILKDLLSTYEKRLVFFTSEKEFLSNNILLSKLKIDQNKFYWFKSGLIRIEDNSNREIEDSLIYLLNSYLYLTGDNKLLSNTSFSFSRNSTRRNLNDTNYNFHDFSSLIGSAKENDLTNFICNIRKIPNEIFSPSQKAILIFRLKNNEPINLTISTHYTDSWDFAKNTISVNHLSEFKIGSRLYDKSDYI